MENISNQNFSCTIELPDIYGIFISALHATTTSPTILIKIIIRNEKKFTRMKKYTKMEVGQRGFELLDTAHLTIRHKNYIFFCGQKDIL